MTITEICFSEQVKNKKNLCHCPNICEPNFFSGLTLLLSSTFPGGQVEDKYLKYTIHSKLKYAEFLGNGSVESPYCCKTTILSLSNCVSFGIFQRFY